MSSTTLKLPFKRFVAQVSTGAPRSKSTYLALMAENLEALKKCPWREAADVSASLTGHDFTAKTQFSDAYDAFKLSGNYDSATMTEVAYAGMVAYRFTIPASAISGSVPVTGISLPIARDRFEKAGVHVAVALSSSAFPSDDWSVVRGSCALAASAQLTQSAANLMAGSPASGTAELDLSGVTSGNPAAYLWVYITLEDYTSHWTMYNTKEKRIYAIEGSAMLVGDSATVTFDGVVASDTDAGTARYLDRAIPVSVSRWMFPSTPALRFRAMSWLGYGNWRHLEPVAEWTVPAGTSDFPVRCYLDTTGRRIPVGDCVIECWAGDGEFEPGMPYGCAVLKNLSAGTTPERAEIELTRTSPIIARIDLVSAMRAADFAAASAATDRGKHNSLLGCAANQPLPDGTTVDLSGFNTTSLTRVRVVRAKLNDDPTTDTVYTDLSGSRKDNETILETYFNLATRHVLTEADILADGKLDLDFATVLQAYGGGVATLTEAAYRVVIGDGEIGTGESPSSNTLHVMFTNLYEGISRQTPTVPDLELSNAEFSGRPTFRWSHTNEINKAYPAFVLRIYTDQSKSNESLVYDSGVLKAPVRDDNGMYEWTAPIQVGTETDEGATIAAGTTYYWAVSMIDSKFYLFNTSSSTRIETTTPFTFAAV